MNPIFLAPQLSVNNPSSGSGPSQPRYMTPPSDRSWVSIQDISGDLLGRSLTYLNIKDLLVAEVVANIFPNSSGTAWERLNQGNPQWKTCAFEHNRAKCNIVLTKALQILFKDGAAIRYSDSEETCFELANKSIKKFRFLIERFPGYRRYVQSEIAAMSSKEKVLKELSQLSPLEAGAEELKKLVDSACSFSVPERSLWMLFKINAIDESKTINDDSEKEEIKQAIVGAFEHDPVFALNCLKKKISGSQYSKNCHPSNKYWFLPFFQDCALELPPRNSFDFLKYLASLYDSTRDDNEIVEKWFVSKIQHSEAHCFKLFFLINSYICNKEQLNSNPLNLIPVIQSLKESIKKFENNISAIFLERIIKPIMYEYQLIRPFPEFERIKLELKILLVLIINKYGDNVPPMIFCCRAYAEDRSLQNPESGHYLELFIASLKSRGSARDLVREGFFFQKIRKNDKAEELWDAALQKDSGNALTLLEMLEIGKLKFNLGKFEEADALFNRVLKSRNPIPLRIIPVIGETKFHIQKFKQAQMCFSHVLRIDEEVLSPVQLRMFILSAWYSRTLKEVALLGETSLRKLKSLPFALEENIQIEGEDASQIQSSLSLLGILGCFKYAMKRYEEAEGCYAEELSRFHENNIPIDSIHYMHLLFYVANNKFALNRHLDTETYLEKIVSIFGAKFSLGDKCSLDNRSFFNYVYYVGDLYLKLQKLHRAEEFFDLALKEDSGNALTPEKMLEIGELKFNLGKFEEADALFTRSDSLEEMMTENFFPIIGETKFHLKKFQLARLFFLDAVRCNEESLSAEQLRMFILSGWYSRRKEETAILSEISLEKLRTLPFTLEVFAMEERSRLSLLQIVALSKNKIGKYVEAEELFANEILRFSGDPILARSTEHAEAIVDAARNKSALKKYAEGMELCEQAINMYEEIGHSSIHLNSVYVLGTEIASHLGVVPGDPLDSWFGRE